MTVHNNVNTLICVFRKNKMYNLVNRFCGNIKYLKGLTLLCTVIEKL